MIAIIIVNYRTPELCIAAIESIWQSTTDDWFVCLADNSDDEGVSVKKVINYLSEKNAAHTVIGSAKEIKAASRQLYIASIPNKGFSHANNYYLSALMELEGWELAFLLNSDAEIFPNTLDNIKQYFQKNSTLGFCGCKLLDYNNPGYIQSVGGAYSEYTGKLNLVMAGQRDTEAEASHLPIYYPSGAAMAIRKAALLQVGLLWEDLFLYGEELYWSHLLRKLGWTVGYCFTAKVLHHGGKSINGSETGTSLLSDFYWLRNRLLLAKRLTPAKYYVMLLCSLLYPINRIRNKQPERVKMYFYIIFNLKKHYSDYIQRK